MTVYQHFGRSIAATAMAGLLATGSSFAQTTAVPTKAGHEIGITVSGYEYVEPSIVAFRGTKAGLDYAGTYILGKNWFARAEARYANGKVDYSSANSGTMNNLSDSYYEVRGLLGKDYAFGDSTVAPYAGIGYRYLFNDFRGVTSTGLNGYRRESTYVSLPIGVTHHMKLENQARLSTTIEVSYLLRGEQNSRLTDAALAQDIKNHQDKGFGWRLGTMYHLGAWSVGPFLHGWNIQDSDRVGGLFEPKNTTTEFGIKAAYWFW
jgi:hypothetical protein